MDRTLSNPLYVLAPPLLAWASLCSAEQPSAYRVTDDQLWAALDLEQPGLAELKAAVSSGNSEKAARAWASYFASRRRPQCHFNREQWPRYVREEFSAIAKAIVAEADQAVAGRLDAYTMQLPVKGRAPDGRIDWLNNPTRDSNYVNLVGCQTFLNPLGRAYLLTGDERYPQTFAWIFDSWFENQEAICKAQGGLNFEVIYRAYYPGIQVRILADNYYCMAGSSSLTPAIHVRLMRQLLAFARYLEKAEVAYRKGNQQVGAVLGLGIAGLVFPEFKDASKWVQQAESLMAQHLREDFFADGGHKELCTQYHKTCLRDIGYVGMTSEANGRPSPLFHGETGRNTEHACDWLAHTIMPTNENPPLHSDVFSTDWAIHLLMSAAYFKRPDHAWLAERFWSQNKIPSQKPPLAPDVHMLCESLSRSALTKGEPPKYLGCHLAESGFAIMRTGRDPNDRYLVFQYGWANTSHAYPAALSFLYEANGELVATHPGSPLSYRHPAYAYCSTTMAHNTISIDGVSYPKLRSIAPGGICEAYADLPGLWYISGRHEGYKDKAGVVHHRQLVLIKDGPLLILDHLDGGAGHTAQWNFHTPLTAEVNANRSVTLSGRKSYRLIPAWPDTLTSVRTLRHWAAVLPKDCQPADCGAEVNGLAFEQPIRQDATDIAIALFEGDGRISVSSPDLIRLTSHRTTYEILGSRLAGPRKVAGIEYDGLLLVLKRIDGRIDCAWIVNGTRLIIDGRNWLKRSEPRSEMLTVQDDG